MSIQPLNAKSVKKHAHSINFISQINGDFDSLLFFSLGHGRYEVKQGTLVLQCKSNNRALLRNREAALRLSGRPPLKVAGFSEMSYFRRKAEVGEDADHFLLVGGELLREVAEDEFQRVIVRRAGAQEGERV